MLKKLVPVELLILLSLFIFAAAVFYWPIWVNPTNIDEYADKYSKSQYVLGTKSTAPISDSELYVYAAHAYWRGEDPTTVNFEHPPLAKYLYGISWKLFENLYLMNLLLFPLLLMVLYHFAGILIKDKKFRLLVVALFAIQPIIYSQLQHVLLDVPLTIAVLLLFITLHRQWQHETVKYVVAGLLLGFTASIKYPIPFIFIPAALVALIAWKEKKLPLLLITFLVSGSVYLASYAFYFVHGHSLLDLVAFEKYRFSWWTGDRTIPKFLIFPNLFFGQHKSWWDDSIQYTKEWNIFLPALFIAFLAALAWMKKNFWSLIVGSFGLGMMLVFGLGAASSLRYLTLLLPFWITIVVVVIENKTHRSSRKATS